MSTWERLKSLRGWDAALTAILVLVGIGLGQEIATSWDYPQIVGAAAGAFCGAILGVELRAPRQPDK